MRDKVAERVLATVMDWGGAEVAEYGSRLQLLAAHKYDSYEGYRPGVKFLENLSGWLDQFETPEERKSAVRFVLDELIFISRAEMDHLIATVYPDVVRPMLIRDAAEKLGSSRFAVNQITGSDQFKEIRRRTLVLGLSDGARIDRLRRASPELSHEQIFLATDIGDEAMRGAVEKLREATKDKAAQFEHVLLVDDFYGSGVTLLRPNTKPTEAEPGPFKGRLWRTQQRLAELAGAELGAVAAEPRVTILVYLASEQAIGHVEGMLAEAGLDWRLLVVQRLSERLRVDDAQLEAICRWHYDPALIDASKPDPAPMGFGNCALPVVLQHNTPNNSICILWADTTDKDDSEQRRALFPRYERHRSDRL